MAALLLAQLACRRPEREADAPNRMNQPPTVATRLSAETRPIESDDPNKPAVEAKIEAIKAAQKAGGHSEASFNQVAEVVTPTLTSVFPGCRFYFLRWNMVPASAPAATRDVSRAWGLSITLVIGQDKEVVELFGIGNHESFGQLLAKRRTVITSVEDASLIWSAFCDAHGKHWKGRASRRISETHWALGEIESGGFKYWYEVHLRTDLRVSSGILRAEKVGG